jgi:hypothetical protein
MVAELKDWPRFSKGIAPAYIEIGGAALLALSR